MKVAPPESCGSGLVQVIDLAAVPMALLIEGRFNYTNAMFVSNYGSCDGKSLDDFFAGEQLDQLNWLISRAAGEVDKIVLSLKEEVVDDARRRKVMVQIWPIDDKFCLLSLRHKYSTQRLADIDELTRLPNRRKALMLLDIERARANRSTGFCLALGDIDHFKNINDTYGHEVGDVVLQQVAQVMVSVLREGDWVARWGGEEFLIFTSDSDVVTGMQPIERIRSTLEQTRFEGIPDLSATMSFGLVSSKGKKNIGELVNEADMLLYEAKRNGRNRTEFETNGTVWVADNVKKVLSEGGIQAHDFIARDWNAQVVMRQIVPYLCGRKYTDTVKMLSSVDRLRERVMIDHALMGSIGDSFVLDNDVPYAFPLTKHLYLDYEAEVLELLQRFPNLCIGINAMQPPEGIIKKITALEKPIFLFNYDASRAPAYLLGIKNLQKVVFSQTEDAEGMLSLLKKGRVESYAELPANVSKARKEALQAQGFAGYLQLPSANEIF